MNSKLAVFIKTYFLEKKIFSTYSNDFLTWNSFKDLTYLGGNLFAYKFNLFYSLFVLYSSLLTLVCRLV